MVYSNRRPEFTLSDYNLESIDVDKDDDETKTAATGGEDEREKLASHPSSSNILSSDSSSGSSSSSSSIYVHCLYRQKRYNIILYYVIDDSDTEDNECRFCGYIAIKVAEESLIFEVSIPYQICCEDFA